MRNSLACLVHPTAIVSPEAELARGVRIGAYAILEGKVRLGPGCVVHPRAYLIGPLVMGKDNQVHTNAVIGDRPQHFKYNDEPTGVEIGDGNTFRENVTVHRGTTHSWQTRIGDGNYFMAGSHVGHDCQVGNRCIFVNNSMLGGHCIISDGAYVSGGAAVHQFCRMGRLSFLGGATATTKDVPPFIMQQEYNTVVGVNVVGMRRGGFTQQQINAIRRVFHIMYLQNLARPNALARIEAELGGIDVVREFIDFISQSQRGINTVRADRLEEAA